jgi:opacity protein-like surface antigen
LKNENQINGHRCPLHDGGYGSPRLSGAQPVLLPSHSPYGHGFGRFQYAGPASNTNEDTDRNNQWDVKAGVEMGRFRFDLGYREYERGKYTTDSFQPPVPTFFYTSKVKSKAWMLSAYYDIVQHNKWSVYGGVGLGQARTDVSTNDTVVQGSGSDTNFAWQGELGVGYALTNAFQIYGGYRYADLGETKINLRPIGGGAPAGDFSADLKSNELRGTEIQVLVLCQDKGATGALF